MASSMLKETPPPVEINISVEKVCYIIVKAREYDAKVEPLEPDPASNPSDDGDREILEDYAGDPTLQELQVAISDLNDDEVVDLIAMAWVDGATSTGTTSTAPAASLRNDTGATLRPT